MSLRLSTLLTALTVPTLAGAQMAPATVDVQCALGSESAGFRLLSSRVKQNAFAGPHDPSRYGDRQDLSAMFRGNLERLWRERQDVVAKIASLNPGSRTAIDPNRMAATCFEPEQLHPSIRLYQPGEVDPKPGYNQRIYALDDYIPNWRELLTASPDFAAAMTTPQPSKLGVLIVTGGTGKPVAKRAAPATARPASEVVSEPETKLPPVTYGRGSKQGKKAKQE